MSEIDKKIVILEAIKKATGVTYDKGEDENLLKYFKPLEMIYVIKFIEEATDKDLSGRFQNSPRIMTLKGLGELI